MYVHVRTHCVVPVKSGHGKSSCMLMTNIYHISDGSCNVLIIHDSPTCVFKRKCLMCENDIYIYIYIYILYIYIYIYIYIYAHIYIYIIYIHIHIYIHIYIYIYIYIGYIYIYIYIYMHIYIYIRECV